MKVSAKNMIVSAQRLKTHKNLVTIVVSHSLREPLGAITHAVVGLIDKMIFSTTISRPRMTFMIFTQTSPKASQKLARVAGSDSTKREEHNRTFIRHHRMRKMPESKDNHNRESKTAAMNISSRTLIKMTTLSKV